VPMVVFRSSSKPIIVPNCAPNKAFHRTAIPLRFIATGELGRWASLESLR